MKTDAYTVGVVLATGAIALSAAVLTGAAIGGAMWAALTWENRTRTRNANTSRGIR